MKMRNLGEKIVNIASKEKPVNILSGLEGYRKNGFWYYRNSNPKIAIFARAWARVTDPKLQNKFDMAISRKK